MSGLIQDSEPTKGESMPLRRGRQRERKGTWAVVEWTLLSYSMSKTHTSGVQTFQKPISINSRPHRNGELNKLSEEDRPVHDWYRFVLSFPPHLVCHYLKSFGVERSQCVLDPFCGTGTTLVECKKHGIPSAGIEANRMAYFASSVKIDWSPAPDRLLHHAETVANAVLKTLEREGIPDEYSLFSPFTGPQRVPLRTLPEEQAKLLLSDSLSPLPMHKTLVLLDHIELLRNDALYAHERLALAKALVTSIGNLSFGPEVGVGTIKEDCPVVSPWLAEIKQMVVDLREMNKLKEIPATIHQADARDLAGLFPPNSIDAVITSPPYPNEKDYTRTTRLESVMLGFLKNKADLQALKRTLVRSNTRNVYREDRDDRWVEKHEEISRIANQIETRRIEMGKTSGFERMYARVTKLYFGGMARHLSELRNILRSGAYLAYVVGDQASYLRVMIRTGQLLADIAQSLGYEVIRIDLFRTRLATATKEQLREEVVVLRWPGSSRMRTGKD